MVGLPACSPGASADALLVKAAEATMAAEAARIRNPLRDKFPFPLFEMVRSATLQAAERDWSED
jgi:hypothetical protein